jgi:hypothetical protein
LISRAPVPLPRAHVPASQIEYATVSARKRPAAEPTTETAKNAQLRKKRQEAWREAEAVTRYWHARLSFEDAVQWVQRMNLPVGRFHPPVADSYRMPMVASWRDAIVKQLLTPAPDARAIIWKKAALAAGDHRYTSVKTERIEQAIADDLDFLAAHPTRRTNSEAMAHRRAFKEAMRRRIRDIAASRNLSDEEIKPAPTLKHHEIGRFVEQHGVNIEWLLEGKGRIFKKDPITLNPNMTGSEFAAVVRTLPADGRRAIEAKIREIVRKRLDEASIA